MSSAAVMEARVTHYGFAVLDPSSSSGKSTRPQQLQQSGATLSVRLPPAVPLAPLLGGKSGSAAVQCSSSHASISTNATAQSKTKSGHSTPQCFTPTSADQLGWKGLLEISRTSGASGVLGATRLVPDESGPSQNTKIEICCTAHPNASVRRLVKSVIRGLKACQEPEKASEGMGGTYFFANESGRKAAILKPCDEEPLAPNNPKGYVGRALGDPGWKPTVRVGEAAMREVAAYLLDHDGWAKVPTSVLVRARHPIFCYRSRMSSVRQSCMDLAGPSGVEGGVGGGLGMMSSVTLFGEEGEEGGGGEGGGGVYASANASSAYPMKLGSLQEFVQHQCDTTEMGSTRFSVSDVHRIGILDIRLFNTDRHAGNILVGAVSAGSGGGVGDASASSNNLRARMVTEPTQYRLIPIDHGFCLPETLEAPYFEWLHWSQAMQPFSEEELAYIRNIDIETDKLILRTELPNLRPECLRVMEVSTTLLKAGAEAGLTLYEIANAMTRPFEQGDEDASDLEKFVTYARQAVDRQSLLRAQQAREGECISDEEVEEEVGFSSDAGSDSDLGSGVVEEGEESETSEGHAFSEEEDEIEEVEEEQEGIRIGTGLGAGAGRGPLPQVLSLAELMISSVGGGVIARPQGIMGTLSSSMSFSKGTILGGSLGLGGAGGDVHPLMAQLQVTSSVVKGEGEGGGKGDGEVVMGRVVTSPTPHTPPQTAALLFHSHSRGEGDRESSMLFELDGEDGEGSRSADLLETEEEVKGIPGGVGGLLGRRKQRCSEESKHGGGGTDRGTERVGPAFSSPGGLSLQSSSLSSEFELHLAAGGGGGTSSGKVQGVGSYLPGMGRGKGLMSGSHSKGGAVGLGKGRGGGKGLMRSEGGAGGRRRMEACFGTPGSTSTIASPPAPFTAYATSVHVTDASFLGQCMRARRKAARMSGKQNGHGKRHGHRATPPAQAYPPPVMTFSPESLNGLFSGLEEDDWQLFMKTLNSFIDAAIKDGRWKKGLARDGSFAASCPRF